MSNPVKKRYLLKAATYIVLSAIKRLGRIFFEDIPSWFGHQTPRIPLSVLWNGADPLPVSPWRVRLREELMRFWREHRQPRRFLRKKYSLQNFFAELDRRGVRYVVLRWFEALPVVNPQEDLDLLVHDEDLPLLDAFLAPYAIRGAVRFDVYSVGGLPGSNYRGELLYFPPQLSERILQNRVRWRNFCYVPARPEYFLSLAYHAVYHKGAQSGLPQDMRSRVVKTTAGKPQRPVPRPPVPEHDYCTVLQKLAKELQLLPEVSVSLRGLHAYLVSAGMAPGTDVIRKLAGGQPPWLPRHQRHPATPPPAVREHFLPPPITMAPPHRCVFFIREWAATHHLDRFVLATLERHGFEIVFRQTLDPIQKQRAVRCVRGGNWQRGPYPVSGGLPQILVVTLDPHPLPPDARLAAEQPCLTNARVHFTKKVLRDYLNSRLPVRAQTNILHSSDDDVEFAEYLQAVCPEQVGQIEREIRRRSAAYASTERILADLSREKRRAKVELVPWRSPAGGGQAVKKTFKSGRERFLQREIYAYAELSRTCPLIPPLLEAGHNFVLLPYLPTIQDAGARKQMIRKSLPEIARFLRFLYDAGWAHLDFKPDNLLFTPEGKLQIIDFEYLQPYREKPQQFRQSYDLSGPPDHFCGDLPVGGHRFITRQWRDVLGAPLIKRLGPWL